MTTPLNVFYAGSRLTASAVNEYLVNTRYATKPGDTSRASTTTLTADPDLSVAVDASKSYWLDILILYTAASGSGDFKYTFGAPTGAVFYGTAVVIAADTLVAAFTYSPSGGATISTTELVVSAGSGAIPVRLSGVLTTSTTAGNLALSWAQNTSSGTATVVKAGSYMCLRRVA